ncbi:YdeI/OmpD-associated family protein [Aeromicrobium duanguangcaii]|uniref:YdeI/OmpD-associated family protein n=1 Tax=Aeromicrobium duanguangcaii TaxID=2968086 RepID=A0ABY5KG02_9ACTN|nr:YdeI/OmpD-associated family protein [Aeromicrobium duanguangcaii]MCD9153696.1 YdeI/OmpD-associated family protein [Aeromicrobium duanguangcaii]UUI69224.1 YdeI/OmpD-associated family protein [Aeromicrobium duanguangcaii]
MTLAITTTLEPRGPAAAVILTDDQVEAFGAGRTFPVRVTIGELSQPARLARMGDENLIGLSKAQREALGVQIGDEVDVRIELDEAPREVEVPEALSEALAAAGLRQAFDALAPSRRKEHARSVAEAKQDDTRERRVQKVLDALRGS